MSAAVSTDAAPKPIVRDADKYPVIDNSQCSFPQAWRKVSEACLQAFTIFDKQPTSDLAEVYNRLNENLCKAHAIVYRLTAYQCQDCPALVRGSSYTRVVGDKPESTQVLVVYYLLREFLKKQFQRNDLIDPTAECIISEYLDAFEKLTASVNLAKCIFTYIHWTWEKLGLPTEHIILPTETVAMHLWIDSMGSDLREKLTGRVSEIVTTVRLGLPMCHTPIENVKRLSLSLLLLNDPRQTYYSSVVETPYVTAMVEFYQQRKDVFKRKGPERYVRDCLKTLSKEEFLARCFLCHQSLQKIRSNLIDLLIMSEQRYLRAAADHWLKNEDNKKRPLFRSSIFALYELMSGGEKATWMEGLMSSYVCSKVKLDIEKQSDTTPNSLTATSALRSVRDTYHHLDAMITEVFGNKQLLFTAMLDGIKEALNDLCEDRKFPNINADKVAQSLVELASEELSSEPESVATQRHWVADIFGLLEKKELFHTTYERFLEVRLLRSTLSDFGEVSSKKQFEREENLLRELFNKGKTFDFAFGCHRMLTDVYKTSLQSHSLVSSQISLQPIILNRFIWRGIDMSHEGEMSGIPPAVKANMERFVAAYKHTKTGGGRVLHFVPIYSTAVVRMRDQRNSASLGVRLVVSVCQLALLLKLNRKATLSTDEMTTATRAPSTVIVEAVKKLADAGIITANPDRSITLNRQYKIPRERKLCVVPEYHFLVGKNTAAPQRSHAETVTSGELVSVCETRIVQFVKKEGEATFESITDYVCTKLRVHNVQRRDVKKALDRLIDKEFIQRDSQGKLFKYLA